MKVAYCLEPVSMLINSCDVTLWQQWFDAASRRDEVAEWIRPWCPKREVLSSNPRQGSCALGQGALLIVWSNGEDFQTSVLSMLRSYHIK